jgi:hypothetical protein
MRIFTSAPRLCTSALGSNNVRLLCVAGTAELVARCGGAEKICSTK